MKFVETTTCLSGQQCEICRHKQQGYFWRRMIARVYEVEGLDFACPHGKPWIDNRPPMPVTVQTMAQIMAPFEPSKMGDCYYMSSRIRSLAPKLQLILSPESPVAVALAGMLKAEQTDDCAGCRRKRWLRNICRAYESSSDEQRKLVFAVLST